MTTLIWLVIIGSAAGIAYGCWRSYQKVQERKRSEEDRFAEFMQLRKPAKMAEAQAPAPESMPPNTLQQEKLLFEAAAKAAEAGEPALSIQLYGRLMARYPSTSFATMANANIETQRRKMGAP